MKVLVLATDYPSDHGHELMYVHVRNKYYQKNGIDVTVLNFRADKDYEYENIKIITLNTYNNKNYKFDILISHASNVRNHYRFIKKYGKNFNRIIFFYHGHEILKLNEVYPDEYYWVKKSFIKKKFQNVYDSFKFRVWRRELEKNIYKSDLIFVSNWLYHRFLYYVRVNPKILEKHVHIINNSVGELFEKESYNIKAKKEYDFITIRGSALDKGKYGIDIVTNLANHNPKLKFLVVGKGNFYNFVKKPNNIEFLNSYLNHNEMLNYLNKSRCALLPTKQDTQGVMTCEMATYGIPTITSDIEVCREIFNGFDNVKLISNSGEDKLDDILKELCANAPYSKNEKYFAKNTIQKEVNLIKNR